MSNPNISLYVQKITHTFIIIFIIIYSHNHTDLSNCKTLSKQHFNSSSCLLVNYHLLKAILFDQQNIGQINNESSVLLRNSRTFLTVSPYLIEDYT